MSPETLRSLKSLSPPYLLIQNINTNIKQEATMRNRIKRRETKKRLTEEWEQCQMDV
uniref:TATA-box-binding protein isoform X2 n=1 Tax=Rhizophora mucronata TaxID=61149 RepID=A0A2P2L6N9_RHIMU